MFLFCSLLLLQLEAGDEMDRRATEHLVQALVELERHKEVKEVWDRSSTTAQVRLAVASTAFTQGEGSVVIMGSCLFW